MASLLDRPDNHAMLGRNPESNATDRHEPGLPSARRTLPAILILLHAGLLAWSTVSNSVTVDEFVHLPSGIANWKYGDFSICCVSPPLVRLWAALPVLAAHPEAPPADLVQLVRPDTKQWFYGTLFQNANRERYHLLFVI